MALRVRYFESSSGRPYATEFIEKLPVKIRAAILADIDGFAEYGNRAPVQWRPIAGHRPMFEIKTGAYRIFCVRTGDVVTVLEVVKKQDQKRGIETANRRMTELLAGEDHA